MKAGLVTVNKSFSSNRVRITLEGTMLMKRTLYGVCLAVYLVKRTFLNKICDTAGLLLN